MGTASLYFLRHGETAWNREGRWQGQTDLELNEVGRDQARAVAAQVAAIRPEIAYASDLKRAVQTAELALGELPVELRLRPELREAHFGLWEGLSVPDIMRDHAAAWNARKLDVVDVAPPQGESLRRLAQRMATALCEIARTHRGQRVLVVSHGFAIAAALAARQAGPLSAAQTLIPKNCEVVETLWPTELEI